MINFSWIDSETELNQHPFPKLLLQKQVDMSRRLEELYPGNDEILATIRNSKDFSDEDRFNLEVHLLLQEVHLKIDRIQQCYIMMDFYPVDIRSAWLTPMTRGEFLEQIMELYIMHSIGLVDRVLILYNFLFDLKLSTRDRKLKNIVRRLSKEDGIPLFAFAMTLQLVRKSRNSITHENRYIDHRLIGLVLEDTFLRDEYRASMPKAQRMFDGLNVKYDEKMKDLQGVIVENDKILTGRYMALLKVIERQYHKRVRLLRCRVGAKA